MPRKARVCDRTASGWVSRVGRDERETNGSVRGVLTPAGCSIRAAKKWLPWVYIGRDLAPNGVKM